MEVYEVFKLICIVQTIGKVLFNKNKEIQPSFIIGLFFDIWLISATNSLIVYSFIKKFCKYTTIRTCQLIHICPFVYNVVNRRMICWITNLILFVSFFIPTKI